MSAQYTAFYNSFISLGVEPQLAAIAATLLFRQANGGTLSESEVQQLNLIHASVFGS